MHGHDPAKLKALLRETITRLAATPLPARFGVSDPPLAVVTSALAMLEGETGFDAGYLPTVRTTPSVPTRQERLDHLVKGTLVPLLVEIWCLQREDSRVMELDLWASPLWRHLNASRPWLKEVFDGAAPSGERALEVSTCESTAVLAPWWVARLEAELGKVPAPKGEAAAADLRRLRRMVELVHTRPALRLVLEAC